MKNQQAKFAAAGSLMCILFFFIVNQITSPHYLWFIYPSFAVLHWPLTMYFLARGNIKPYSLVTSLLIIAFLIIENNLCNPEHPWFLYASYPLLWWPILMYSGKYAKTLSIAVIGCLFTILYYSMINSSLSPQYPWAIYPAFAVLWWPLSIYFVKKKDYWGYSIWASILIIVFFVLSNAVSSANTIWAVYPIFAVLWWPLSMYYYRKRV
jgi:hypothetical protein